ncbi:MAG TPA: acyl-CoA dehydrogenase [Gammaproteobacteria bacterium]|nr:acyl-CoA dehydrogenase [Gammaproteobacteria bacterium]
MAEYVAPMRDLSFVLFDLLDYSHVLALPGLEEATPDLIEAVLGEAGRLATEVLSPLNRTGDVSHSQLQNGEVVTPEGWKEAYRLFVDGGWNSLAVDTEYGGQGLPWLVSTAVQELWAGANMSFGLCPLLTQGAVEALIRHGSKDLQARYLENMISGEWTGTMNLTESQAGSDLAAIKTMAVPEGDHYRLHGQKIFITYGDHDLTENIIHMVLAKTPGAPSGVKGISLFLVPRNLLDEQGKPGQENDVTTVSLEHKMGIHASPTAVLSYGDGDGAVGYLVGEIHEGLKYMFVMMNLARNAVGVQALGVAERSWQQALAYASERVQGQALEGGKSGVPIIEHPDVQRMLLSMKSQVEAMRALDYYTALQLDCALREADPDQRQASQALYDFLTPVVKGWSTETAAQVVSTGLQVHGGMGYIEETGAAQLHRDVRITTIYEGTTGIQAADLMGRKLLRDRGQTAQMLITQMRQEQEASRASDPHLATTLGQAIDALEQATQSLLGKAAAGKLRNVFAVSVPYLMLWGVVGGGWLLIRSARIAAVKLQQPQADRNYLQGKITSARFFADHQLTLTMGLATTVESGDATLAALDIDTLATA